MKNGFQKAATEPLSEAEEALKSWGIEYSKQPDGSILVPEDLDISAKGLTRLPNLSSVKVLGYFSCHDNQLTSLKGAPRSVGGNFYCSFNQLTSLEHAPQTVGGHFFCSFNQLPSLEHAPQTVGGNFVCSINQLTSLEHAPQTVGGHFFCSYNQLTSLEHAPHTVGGSFDCHNNQLTSLEGASKTFKTLQSDFGTFASWDSVPEQLRLSPATRARLEEERQIAFSEGATVLQAPVKISSPLRLKK